MCGIVGGVSQSNNILPFLISGLKSLEYRGYDSAGLAVQQPSGVLRLRAVGRVQELNIRLPENFETTPLCGIAHTRWATHGVPAERNAHPHTSKSEDYDVAVVHNGIIENHEALRQALLADGYVFTSDTDTEVVAHLVHFYLKKEKNLRRALKAARSRLVGLYAIAVIDAKHPNYIVATRQGAPLVLGISDNGTYLASDVSALLSKTNRVVYLEDGDVATLEPSKWSVVSSNGAPVSRGITVSKLSAQSLDLGEYEHFMQKEIYEQPAALLDTLAMAGSQGALCGSLFGPEGEQVLAATKNVLILACGTSFHSGLVARHWIEGIAGVPCSVEVASEFRYRKPAVMANTLVVTISQSGETADTRAALEYAQSLGMSNSLSICNVPESALTRMSNLKFLTRAGPEIGVASTKAFTTQLAALYLLALSLKTAQGDTLSRGEGETMRARLQALQDVPRVVNSALGMNEELKRWASILETRSSAIFLGRGPLHAIAMEGALKLKEIAYIHAEAYSAGELKHGPLALIDKDMPVIVSVANDDLLDKIKANIEEILARSGEVFIIADHGCGFVARAGVHVLELPENLPTEIAALVHVVPLQLLAYYTALARGTDVDKPRNLAKCVTVE